MSDVSTILSVIALGLAGLPYFSEGNFENKVIGPCFSCDCKCPDTVHGGRVQSYWSWAACALSLIFFSVLFGWRWGVSVARPPPIEQHSAFLDYGEAWEPWHERYVFGLVEGRVSVVITPDMDVFEEPLEYMPREGWYGQYKGQELDDNLALKRDIRPVTGATLTARATNEAVRRVLAIHAVVAQEETP